MKNTIFWVITTRRYILEDGTLHNHRCENLKSYVYAKIFYTSRNIVEVNVFLKLVLSDVIVIRLNAIKSRNKQGSWKERVIPASL
jgi:hypothetical protein